MALNRRDLLQGLASTGAAALLPSAALAQNLASKPRQNTAETPDPSRSVLRPEGGWPGEVAPPGIFRERHHVFFPSRASGAETAWVHAVSRDGVHWNLRPISIAADAFPDALPAGMPSLRLCNGVPSLHAA